MELFELTGIIQGRRWNKSREPDSS